MMAEKVGTIPVQDLLAKYKPYQETMYSLTHIKTTKTDELKQIYKQIKTNFLDTNIFTPARLYRLLELVSKYNNRYLRSYLYILKLVSEEFQIYSLDFEDLSDNLHYFFYKEYGFTLQTNHEDDFNDIDYGDITLDIFEENTIYQAIMNDDKDSFVKYIESDGFDIDQTFQSTLFPDETADYSFLELCCYYGSVNCFKILRQKFNSEITQTCLSFSFISGIPDIINECLKFQNPEKECMDYAIISQNMNYVTYLYNNFGLEIDLNICAKVGNIDAFLFNFAKTKDIKKCFIYSSRFSIFSLFEFFMSIMIRKGLDINAEGKNSHTALHYAAQNNNKEIVKLLIENGVDINKRTSHRRMNALHYATKYNCKETAELLILSSAKLNKIDSNYMTALQYATQNNCKELVALLLLNGADPNKHGIYTNTALQCAAKNNNIEIASLLISSGADVNTQNCPGETALHIAAEFNYKEIAVLLIANGANADVKDNDGNTALHKAAIYNRNEIADFIISNGANINERNKYNATPLHCAADKNSKETAELLISYGANINEKDEYGRTILYYAARRNSLETAELLIANGTDINEPDIYRNTALHAAARCICKEVTELLILFGADINAKDKYDKTPLYYAEIDDNKETAELLKAYGGKVNIN